MEITSIYEGSVENTSCLEKYCSDSNPIRRIFYSEENGISSTSILIISTIAILILMGFFIINIVNPCSSGSNWCWGMITLDVIGGLIIIISCIYFIAYVIHTCIYNRDKLMMSSPEIYSSNGIDWEQSRKDSDRRHEQWRSMDIHYQRMETNRRQHEMLMDQQKRAFAISQYNHNRSFVHP